jgi:hypothetical protein
MVDEDTAPPPLVECFASSGINGAVPVTDTGASGTQASAVSEYIVRSLSRTALRMLWHQRLGHLNFRRLSTMHRFVKGMPEFTLPNELEACPVCLAAKVRKQPAGTATTMRSTVCNQGISIDFGFMVQRSKNSKRQHNLVGINGETCYALITDHYSGRLYGRAFASKAPLVEWLNNWLANNAPDCPGKYVRMDGGGELGKSRDVHRTFSNFGYTVELTGPDSSHQNGPGERPHQTIGDALRSMLSGANLQSSFWPYAFYHYIRLYNFVPHGTRPSSPYEMCGTELPNLSKLRTFGCRAHVRPTTMRYGKVVPNSRLGIFLGYSRTLKVLYYYDLEGSMVKTATHARFDEGMNDLVSAEAPPNVQLLRQLNNDGSIAPDRIDLSPLNLSVSDDPFDHLDKLSPAIACDHPTLGFEISECHIRKRGYVSGIVANTSASRIKNVRRKYIGAFVVSINDTPTFTAASAILALQSAASSDEQSFRIVFAPDRYIPVSDRRHASPLHLSVDQLRTVNQILSEGNESMDSGDECMDDNVDCPILIVRSLNTTTHGTAGEQALGSFTRRKLKGLSNWNEWQESEFKQLDSMAKQEMYGKPCLPPKDAIILRQHWNYSLKADGTRKARKCCDGSPRSAPQLKLANTYSSCIEQPCMRMFFALCAHEGFIALKVDATNAYANSPPPDQPTFVYIDDQYADWYLARHGVAVSQDMVLPVQHALQGHPESGALWEKFVNTVIARHGFTATTHERSLYHGTYKGHRMLICRQVDDLAIGCADPNATQDLVATICKEDKIDLRDEGVLDSFNGVDVDQTDRYVKIAYKSYIDKLLAHYGWSAAGTRDTDSKPIEPLASSTLQQMFAEYDTAPLDGSLEHAAIEAEVGFSYRSVLGALIYAYVVTRPDIGYAVTTLARFSDHPAKIHYDALRCVARYLRMTKSWGLIYWRHQRLATLPVGTFQTLPPSPSLPSFPEPNHPTLLAGYVDAAHATDVITRRSITGLVFMFCGGPIAYKSKIQSTVSTSSTEAEFIAAVHAAKIAKYLRSILSELGYPQDRPTTLYEDNAAAILMINASRPTSRSRHIDIQHFAIQEWKANREIVLAHIPGIINSADSLTKSLGSTLHHRHVRRLMGHYGAPWTPHVP